MAFTILVLYAASLAHAATQVEGFGYLNSEVQVTVTHSTDAAAGVPCGSISALPVASGRNQNNLFRIAFGEFALAKITDTPLVGPLTLVEAEANHLWLEIDKPLGTRLDC
jgi:hypothetical protein